MVTAVQWTVGSVAAAMIGTGAFFAYGALSGGPSAAAQPPRECIKPITMAAVGDVLLHGTLQRWADQQPEGFYTIMKPVQDLMEGADVTIANLEGPAADTVAPGGREVPRPATRYDDHVFKGYPLFNYHPSIITDLQKLGVDALQTANNHSLDRGSLGVDRTLAALDAARMPHTGTRLSNAQPRGFRWWTSYTVRRGNQHYKFAFISCAYGTNGLPDDKGQVLKCYDQREELLAQVRAMRADRSNAAVIVMPHWGVEYQPLPEDNQTGLARDLAEAGATAIIGTHPHVVQPEALLTTSDGRSVPVVYSLGNFVSWQQGLPRLSTVIYMLGFTPARDGRLAATTSGWIPLRMKTGDTLSLDPLDRLPEDEAAPFSAHLLKTYAAEKKLPADPAAYWNRTAKEVCTPSS